MMTPTSGAGRDPIGVILTAGLGTRLRPLTNTMPKSLVPLLNRPLIAHGLECMARLGLREVVVVVGPDDHRTGAAAREQAPEGMLISSAVQAQPLGPANAVAAAGDMLADRAVVVLSVDTVLVGIDARPFDDFLESRADAGLILSRVVDPRAFGVAVLDEGRVTHLEEKPTTPLSDLAVVGVWMLGPDAVGRVRTNPHINQRGESDLTATVADILYEGGDIRGWELEGEWLDSGTCEGLLTAQLRMFSELRHSPPEVLDSDLSGIIASADGTRVAHSRVDGPVLIGCDVRIDGCEIEASTIGDRAILRGVTLRRSIVVAGATLEGGTYEDVVIDAEGRVGGPGSL